LTGAAFGLGKKVALAVRFESGRYGVIEYNICTGAEETLTESERRIDVIGESASGWIVGQNNEYVGVIRRGGISSIFPQSGKTA